MKTAPFDLEKALAGHPLVTRLGLPATQFSCGSGGYGGGRRYPFVAVVEGVPRTYARDGRYRTYSEDPLDLFLAIDDTPPNPMKTAPFDLEIALAGHPLVTRDGRPVRNFAAREGLVNAVYPYQAEVGSGPFTYTSAGRLLLAEEDPLDLFLAIEDAPTQPSPRFQVGDLVRHRASGTRGVVVRVNEYQTESPRYDVSTEFGDRTSTLVKEVVLEPWTSPTYGPSPVLKRILEDRDYSDLT